jgi:hypothetical protein
LLTGCEWWFWFVSPAVGLRVTPAVGLTFKKTKSKQNLFNPD